MKKRQSSLNVWVKSFVLFTAIMITLFNLSLADQSDTYDWEDGGVNLGFYGNAVCENSTEQAHDGTHSMKFTEEPLNQTPQVYIWWITGLSEGDVIDASFWVYDSTPEDEYPKGRIWGHYTSDPEDINSYAGSASGNEAYSTEGWSELSYSWTFEAGTDHDGFVLESRIYSGDGANIIYVDETEISVNNDDAVIHCIELPSDPTIQNAYCASNSELLVYYDLDMESVSADNYALSGTADITFGSATIDGSDAKLVHLTDPSENMVGDLQVDTITDSENPSDSDLYAGILPISITNTLNPQGTIENDITATFSATVSANDGYNNVWVSENPGPYNGSMIYDMNFPGLVSQSDAIVFAGTRDEYYGLTEIKNPALISSNTSAGAIPSTIPGSQIDREIPENTNPGEQWEGQLIRIEDVSVATPVDTNLTYIASDDDWETTFIIGDNVDYNFGNSGDILDQVVSSGQTIRITGISDFSFGSYRINPRDSMDILITGNDTGEEQVADAVVHLNNYPNPVRNNTTISYHLSQPDFTNQKVKIYNLQGQLVKTLNAENNGATLFTANWNTENENGNTVKNGIYFYEIKTADRTILNKMILIR